MSTTTETRKQLKSIPDIASFDDLLARSTLSDLDKSILRLHYLEEKDFCYIGDALGYAEITIKKRHVKALKKIAALF